MLPRALRPFVAWTSRWRLFRRIGPSIMPVLERAWRGASRGRTPLSGVIVPSLVLHTVGAKTGLRRDIPLMYCPADNGRMFITGSNFAGAQHPAWSFNLIANPDAAVTVRGRRFPVRTELIGADEREAVWAELEANWPGYRQYERSAGRDLRIFRITPVE
jgi:deazaflavin-dependent oxidoreductase (nitroreductase family)